MPIFKKKDENFFKKWNSEMAYILGFFTADGSMTKNKRGAHFIEFQITDKDLLSKIQKRLGSNHKISVRRRQNDKWRTVYRLQVGSKEIYNDLLKLGLKPKKSKRLSLPKIPLKFFSDFTRGYFDGDGNVTVCTYKRKARNNKLTTILQSGFTSGSKNFLKALKTKFLRIGIIRGGTLYYSSNGWRLYFSINDSKRLYNYLYAGLNKTNKLFLNRKKTIFEKYLRA